MTSDADVVELITLIFAGKISEDEAKDMAERLRWATIDEIDKAAREWRITSRFKPTLPDLKKLINDGRNTQRANQPRPEKSHAEILAAEMKLSAAAAVISYWRGVWSRYAADAVGREINLPPDGSGRDRWEAQYQGMACKVRWGVNAALRSLGGHPDKCESIADQITAAPEKFDRTFAWLCENALPLAGPAAIPPPTVRRAIFGENLFRSVPPLINHNELDRQRKALAKSKAGETAA